MLIGKDESIYNLSVKGGLLRNLLLFSSLAESNHNAMSFDWPGGNRYKTFICKHMMFHYHVVFLRIVPIRSLFGKYDNNQFPKLSLSYNTSVEGDRLLLRYGEGCLCVDWLLERWGVACAEVFQQNQNATRRKFHSVLTRQITDSDRLIYCQSL